MKKLMLATTLLAASSAGSPAWAGGIQIDPSGLGNIGNSTFVSTFGDGSTGDLLLAGLSSVGTTGVMYGQNDLDISLRIGGVDTPYELTFVFGRKATTTTAFGSNLGLVNRGDTFDGTGPDPLAADFHASGGSVMSETSVAGADSYFELWLDTARDANHSTGANYDDGVRLAAGVIRILTGTLGPNAAGVGPCAGSPGVGSGCLSAGHTNTVSKYRTQSLAGSFQFEIEFIDSLINTGYVVNNLKTANIDLDISSGAAAPYNQPSGTASPAANRVGGSLAGHGETLVGDLGADGFNNQSCNADPAFDSSSDSCSYQVQINSTVTFNAERIPEPGTLALVGAALGLAGWRAKRRTTIA